jgi:tagatose 6-phosphate kinase
LTASWIVAAGLSPAWQQIMRFDGFRAGEVNRAIDVQWCASGKVLNVGIALAHLGAASETISLVGGATGEQIKQEFRSLGVQAAWVPTRAPTRVCTTILDLQTGGATELVENAAAVDAAELDAFRSLYAARAAHAQCTILTGSLPIGAPPGFFRELLDDTACPAIVDVRGPELLAVLARRVFLVKPNREELARTVGREIAGDAQLHSAMLELNARGAEWVVISDGPRPAWASSRDQIFCLSPPRVEPVNPIGSGDCLAAGIAWALTENSDTLAALRQGMGAAAYNVGQLLPARLDRDAVAKYAAMVVCERVR